MRGGWAILAAAMIATGCGRGRTVSVYVDVARVAAADPLLHIEASPTPTPPAPLEGTRFELEALPARKLDFSQNKGRIDKVRAAVDEARERTIDEVSRKLREAYQREIDAIEDKRMSELGAMRTAALDRAWAAVRTRFLKWADERAPLAIRVSLVAGFPAEPGFRLPASTLKARQRQATLAQEAQTQLQNLDAAYESDVKKLIAGYDDEVAGAITHIRIEVERMRADAEAKARQDAVAQAAKLTEEVESVLAGRAEVDLVARPGRTVTTPGSAPLRQAPSVNFPSEQDGVRMRLEAVRSDARLWAAHRGYVLVEGKSDGSDRTDEFVAWRQQHNLGH